MMRIRIIANFVVVVVVVSSDEDTIWILVFSSEEAGISWWLLCNQVTLVRGQRLKSGELGV